MKILIGISWAILIAIVFFGAIEIQTRLNAEIDKRADNKLKGSWCNVDFGSSSAKESGALRRASMDLTRQLAQMRKP